MAQMRRFPAIERRSNVVALVADVSSGRIIGGVHAAEAFEQRFHPASVFKIALAEVALRSGGVSRLGSYECTGRDTVAGRIDRCWTPKGHGRVDLEEAIAHSCNLYFRALSRLVSRQDIIQSARRLGMLSRSGFPGSSEPDVNPKLDDNNILGEAFVVSPAQMLRMALILASRRVTAGVRFDPLHKGLRRCVSEGTAREAWLRKMSIAGKTGTDMTSGLPGHSAGWFIGYAPADNPRYAVVVLLKNGRGSGAARIARDIFGALR
jgi:cell division protein FtsI/penicillin-binding protein 2